MIEERRLPGVFRLGDLEVHPDANEIVSGNRVVRLEPKVMDLLVALAASPGEVVSRERLLDTVWPDAFVSDEALTTAVYQLRRALGDDARSPRFVETVPKRGYRLLAPMGAAPIGGRTTAAHRRSGATGVAVLAASILAMCLVVLWRPPPLGRGAPVVAGPRSHAGNAQPSLPAERAASNLVERTDARSVGAALERFERATAQDPRDASAQAGLAEALVRAHALGLVPAAEVRERARQAVGAALDNAPGDATAHRAQALVALGLDWDFGGAHAALRRAVALDPGDPHVHSLLAQLHFIAGRREAALAAAERSHRLGPDSPRVQTVAGTIASVLARPDLASRAFGRALALDPSSPEAARGLAKLGSAPEVMDDVEPRRLLDRIAGKVEEGHLPPSALASLYAELGDRTQALEWLDRAWRSRDPGLFFLRYDTRWTVYRDHPRVRALLARLAGPGPERTPLLTGS